MIVAYTYRDGRRVWTPGSSVSWGQHQERHLDVKGCWSPPAVLYHNGLPSWCLAMPGWGYI